MANYKLVAGKNDFIETVKIWNADFDGDVLNTLGLELEEINSIFKGFDPTNMLINRSTGSIRLDLSALEDISVAMFSDIG